MSQDPQQVLPSFQGANLAPLEPILQLRDGATQVSHYLQKAIQERFLHFKNLEAKTRNNMLLTAELIANFIEGKQILAPKPYGAGWMVIKPTRDDATTKRVMNLTRFYARNCLVKWMLSNPQVMPKPGNDRDESIAAAKGASVVLPYYAKKFFTPWENWQQGLECLTFGTYIERFRHDPMIKGNTAIREIMQDQEVPFGTGYGYCGECQYAGEAQEFQSGETQYGMDPAGGYDDSTDSFNLQPQSVESCPKCGSPAVQVEQPPTGVVSNAVGQEQVELGDLKYERLSMAQCYWDFRERFENSSWKIISHATNLANIRRLLGPIRLPGGEASDLGLEVMARLAYIGTALGGNTPGSDRSPKIYKDPVNTHEFWMSPEDYADIPLQGNEKTISGIDLPPGLKMTDVFPDGCVAIGLNDMSVLTGLYGEKPDYGLVSGVWDAKLHSGTGDGIPDTIEVQKRLNAFDSKAIQFMAAQATPAVLHDKTLIKSSETRYLGAGPANIPVDLSQIPQGKGLRDAVLRMEPGTMSGQFYEYTYQRLNEFMQLTMMVTDFTSGLPNVNNKTATGANITQANANSIFTPPLQLKGEVRKTGSEHIIRLFAQHQVVPRYFPMGGRKSKSQGTYLSGLDLRYAIDYEVVRDSELPKNNYIKRQDSTDFFLLCGGIEGYLMLKQAEPETAVELKRLFNVTIDDDEDDDATAEICINRLDQMSQLLELTMMSGESQILMARVAQPTPEPQDPSMAGVAPPVVLGPPLFVSMLKPPVSQYEPRQKEKAIWFSEWLDDDKGQESPQELRQMVEMMIELHFQYHGQQGAAIGAQQGAIAMAQAGPGAMSNAMIQGELGKNKQQDPSKKGLTGAK